MEWRPTGQVSGEAHAQELKGSLLQGWGRRHVDGHIASNRRLEPDAGQRGEMLHQVSKAPNRQAAGRTSGGELRLGTVSIYMNTAIMMEKEKARVCG